MLVYVHHDRKASAGDLPKMTSSTSITNSIVV